MLDDLSRGKERNIPSGARLVRADIRSPEAGSCSPRAASPCSITTPRRSTFGFRWMSRRSTLRSIWWASSTSSTAPAAGGVRRVVFASSGGVVYGDPEVIPTPETAPKMPVSPYGVSKLAGEYYLRALAALRGFEGIAMRYANVFGPRQDPKSEAGVVSIFVSRLLGGQTAHRVRRR